MIWNVYRQDKIYTSDLSEIVGYLVGRRRVLTQIQGHTAVFEPITFPEGGAGRESTLIDIINAAEGIRLTVDRNDTVREIQWRDKFAENDVVKKIVQVFYPAHLQFGLKGDIHITAHGDRIVYEQKGLDIDQNYLRSLFDLLIYLIETYPSVVALGGETIQPLIQADHILSAIAPQLIQDIALNTQKRIGEDPSSYICPRCLVRCTVHKASLSAGQQVKYCGCRICHQSRNVIKWEKPVTVVLDNTEEAVSRGGLMRENWITRRRLFDFDEVEILQATDEEIERFAIQVGNEMDIERKGRQTQIRCRVSAACEISENTLRILKSMFGKIEVIAVP